MQKRLVFLIAMLMMVRISIMAQVTTSSISGKVIADNKPVIGATITATYTPSGTVYRSVTNTDGRYSISGMRVGGPYTVEISYIGFQSQVFKNVNLILADNAVINATLKEGSEVLSEVVVVGTNKSNMKSDRAGAITSVDSEKMAMVPTVSRSMNDILKLTPQGGNTGNGFAVGGGNYRQSFVTVDGAAFNNAFGIGSNLPSGGSPISLDALDQISVSVTPYDVRQSGFTGGAINATTKSGTNDFKGTAYFYNTNVNLRGNKVSDYELQRNRAHTTTYGASFGGPIIKNKLFFFLNGEYEANVSAGPSGMARTSDSDKWDTSGNVHRPTVTQMDAISDFLQKTYGYNPGRYQGYSLDTPAYRLLARLDWNIDDNNKLNFRFTKTHFKNSNSPSSSTSPFSAPVIYPGGKDGSAGNYSSGRTSNTSLYFESARYFQEQEFTSVASELNSKWGLINNALRLTYSYQDEPRIAVGGTFPTVDILENGSVYTTFGPDPFTAGNLRQVKTFVATDEANYTWGIHKLLAGVQFETNSATNGYMQGGNGYYVYSSWDDFVKGNKPAAYGVTFSMSADRSQFKAKMKYNQFSWYLQDQMNVSDNFRLTAGLRFEVPMYPELKNNYNEPYAALKFRDNKQYATDQVPDAKLTVSPRVGFNWDITGERKYVLRGGTGYFVGRLPFVWLVSAVGNSNCGQYTYFYNTVNDAKSGQPDFHTTVADQLKNLTINTTSQTAPQSPTIIDKNLKLNATWKTSLAFDAKLPYDIDFSLEGIYNKDFNPAVITNENYVYDKDITLSANDTRKSYKYINKFNDCYLITNGGHHAYYYSLTASLAKKFNFGLDLSASYTYSNAKSYSDGIGDQVTSAYKTNRYSINGMNDMETGYGTYVAPHRLLVTASYYKAYAKNFATRVGLVYEGMNMGYSGSYAYTRYSYTFSSNVVGDYGSNSLIYIPESLEALKDWKFKDYTAKNTNGKTVVTYSADDQRTDFWNYINQDSYLKKHKGEYTERGAAMMPWHHQLDFKLTQDFYMNVGGKRNTLQFGVDIKNLANLINSDWGLYKQVNNSTILSYAGGAYQFQKNGTEKLQSTYTNYKGFDSTYSIQFSIRYIFN